MKRFFVIVIIILISYSCKVNTTNKEATTKPKVVPKSSDTSNADSNVVNLADSANKMINKAENKINEAADKTKDAVK